MDLISLALLSLAAGGTTYILLDAGAGIADLAIKLDYDFNVKVFKIRGLSLKIVIDFILKNPTDKQLKISHPLIMLYYLQPNGERNFLAQNTVYDKTYILPPYGNLVIPNLDFSVSISDLVSIVSNSIAPEATTLLQQGKLVQLANVLGQSIDKIRENIVYESYFKINGIEIKYQSNLAGLGYSPLSAIERPIKDGRKYDRYFALPRGKSMVILKDAEVEDTVRQMHKIVEKDAHLIREFSQLFKSDSVYETAKKIYDWIYDYLKYNIEKGEQLKNPLVSYHYGQRKAREFYAKHGYYHPDYSVDCDDISIFIASILHNLGIPYAFRIAAYTPNRGYQHVYVITWDKDGKEIIIDPVYWKFDAEKPYVKEKTMSKLDGIPVEYLYGTETDVLDHVYNLLQSTKIAIQSNQLRIKGKRYLLPLYDYLLRYWHTPQRQKAIEIVARNEANLCRQGKIAKHNFFRLLANTQSLSGFWDWAKRNVGNYVMLANPLTAPIGIYNMITGKKIQSVPAKTQTQKTVTPYNDNVSTTSAQTQYTPPPDDSMFNEPQEPSFWQKIKKPLMIGGTFLVVGSAGIITYKTLKNKHNGTNK